MEPPKEKQRSVAAWFGDKFGKCPKRKSPDRCHYQQTSPPEDGPSDDRTEPAPKRRRTSDGSPRPGAGIYTPLQAPPSQIPDRTTEGVSSTREEMRRRRIRNQEMEEALKSGATISFRSSGNSPWPRVASGQVCTLIPVRFAETVNDGNSPGYKKNHRKTLAAIALAHHE